MKLDRNVDRGGRGKYALVNMRKLIPMMDHVEAFPDNIRDDNASPVTREIVAAFELLVNAGIITLGTESPGDQFFVMKYKDRFTCAGLRAYADAVAAHAFNLKANDNREEAHKIAESLHVYASQIRMEVTKALQLGNRIPD